MAKTSFKTKNEILKEYNKVVIQYDLSEEQSEFNIHTNEMYFDKIKEALEHLGFFLEIDNNELRLGTTTVNETTNSSAERLSVACTRNAGRKPSSATKEDGSSYTYADVTKMIYTMPVEFIIEKLGISRDAYYRRRKKLFASEFYKKILDKASLTQKQDLTYLNSIPGARTLF